MDKLRKAALPITFIAATILPFIFISSEVVEHHPIGPDTFLLTLLHNHATHFLAIFFKAVTSTGGLKGIIVIAALLGAFLLYKKRRREVYFLVTAIVSASLLNYVLKLLFERNRPDLWPSLITEYYYSYPSGHAMASSAVTFAVIYIAWKTRFRWPVVIIASIYAFFVGLSRIYLGVHYPSDVVAGWIVSFFLVTLLSSLFLNFPFKFRKKKLET